MAGIGLGLALRFRLEAGFRVSASDWSRGVQGPLIVTQAWKQTSGDPSRLKQTTIQLQITLIYCSVGVCNRFPANEVISRLN